MDVVELAPDVRPARDLDGGGRLPLLRRVEIVEPGIAVGLQQAAEAGEVRPRMLALAIRAVAVEHRRRRRSGARAVVAQVDPQPTDFGARPGSSTGTGVSSACSLSAAMTWAAMTWAAMTWAAMTWAAIAS